MTNAVKTTMFAEWYKKYNDDDNCIVLSTPTTTIWVGAVIYVVVYGHPISNMLSSHQMKCIRRLVQI